MKNLFFTILVLFISLSATAQAGVYKTLNDFLNDKITEHGGKVKYNNTLASFTLIFKKKGEKVKYNLNTDEVWGFRNEEGYVYRINGKKHPYMIIEVGAICYYTNYTTVVRGNRISFEQNNHVPQISKGLDGEMINLTTRKLKMLLNESEEGRTYLEKYKPNNKLFSGTPYLKELIDYITAFNKYVAD